MFKVSGDSCVEGQTYSSMKFSHRYRNAASEFSLTPSRRTFLLVPALGLLPNPIESRVTLPPAQRPITRVLLGGDVMLARYVGALARQRADPAWPLRNVADLFSSADIAFVNLEAPFSDRGRKVESGMVFKAEPEMIESLRVAGIDIVSTANNHARDCGRYGIEFTLDWLQKNGVETVGTAPTAELAHAGTILERNQVGFGFLAYTYDQSNGNHADQDDRVAMMDVDAMTADVQSLLKRTDLVIVSMHAGTEYQQTPNAQQRKFARAAIDAGATVVVGHHPHVTQPVEAYAKGVIFYSLGNLAFDQFQRKETQLGLIADLRFSGKRLAGYGVIPVEIIRTVPRIVKT
jgi:poly-gamma-glutamate capsule biosynthesis protein CapA/YwtB (metallophosphatase superfamily)